MNIKEKASNNVQVAAKALVRLPPGRQKVRYLSHIWQRCYHDVAEFRSSSPFFLVVDEEMDPPGTNCSSEYDLIFPRTRLLPVNERREGLIAIMSRPWASYLTKSPSLYTFFCDRSTNRSPLVSTRY